MEDNINRKICLNYEAKYILREKDIFDYTILCLNKLKIDRFSLDDFFIAFREVCNKYNNERFVTEYVPRKDEDGKFYNSKLVSYLQIFNKNRYVYYKMIKDGDFSRYNGGNGRNAAINEMFECGFGIYKPEKNEVVSVFGKIFSQRRADYLIKHIDKGLEEIFDEVAQGIIENKKNREEGENCVNK